MADAKRRAPLTFHIPERTDPQSRATKFLYEHLGFNYQAGDPVAQPGGIYHVPVQWRAQVDNVGTIVIPKTRHALVSGPTQGAVEQFLFEQLFPRQARALATYEDRLPPTRPPHPDVIQQLREWCKTFLESQCYWVRNGHLPIEAFQGIMRVVEQCEHELIMRGCRCPHCHELGFNRDWNKNTRGYDCWCEFCGHELFEPEM